MGKHTILVDDPDIRDVLTDALTGEGYSVQTALGTDVLTVAQEHRPAAILLDVMMPILDGARLSRLLRANPSTARIPIIAISVMPQRSAPTSLRYDNRMEKPFDLQRPVATVDTVIR